ncbi:hypothetical protein [Myroides marinus]|uniref:IPT/TIG domain-containing protein n=1 Tax=Myroides marinus TaxID=703342 RepID=A0A1H6YSM5_9FLAO|nr:hypothetical protein [Myroides marinus]MDM1378016.1 hypothetical protein [Myroides marinus]MDM1385287.1 hypothetical protein [Myroides marinus]MDM1392500.1 hypothetical protein [Myroides marinus]MDM1503757.1 hypothetical protein [Myroides marinus]SEJ43386.1 hypothetical protein SAMN04488018_14310 [Myroides marinus]
MKKLILLFLATATFSVVSCSSDDGGSKDIKPEGYPETLNQVDFNAQAPGTRMLLTGKGFDEAKSSEYKITFVKALPTKSSNAVIAPRAPKPEESNENIEAYIFKVTPTEVHFEVPKEVGNGTVNFEYKKYKTPIGNYQKKVK